MTAHVPIRFQAEPLHQNLELSAQIALVDSLLQALLQALQFQKARLLLVLRYVIIKFCRRRAGALRVLEDVERVISNLLDQGHSILKVGLSLAGKADDDITSYGQPAPCILNLRNPFVSAMISDAGRLFSRPRENGTMQYVQNLLQPSMMGTKATCFDVRAVAGTSHFSPSARSSRSMTRLSPSSARLINSGKRSVARVPTIRFTEGLLSKSVRPSNCATQPITPITGS